MLLASSFLSVIIAANTLAVNFTKFDIQSLNPVATVAIAGDVMFEAELGAKVKAGLDPFKHIRSKWDKYDLRVINLETNISTVGKHRPANKNFRFNATKSSLPAMQKGRVDVVSLANNHAMDYGSSALLEQMKLLTDWKIAYFGVGKNLNESYKPLIKKVNNTKVAFLGFNAAEASVTTAKANAAGTAPLVEARVAAAIKDAKSKADVVIVYPHWGIEHTPNPTARQRYWGRKLVDYGADLVVGAHPHVVQSVETYKGKQIYYSLGNFIFVGMWHRPKAMEGEYLEIQVFDKKIVGVKRIPYKLNSDGIPVFK